MPTVVTEPPDQPLQPDGAKLGGWWHQDLASERIICDLCPRTCALKPGDRGFCFVRQNRDGQMVLDTYGRSTGFCIDPIEKKPLNHFYPGTSVLSFGTAGCNLACKFCQNWSISKSREVKQLSESATPPTIARAAHELGCRSVAFTYNDPIIWAEYAIDVARECAALGIKSVAVTAGYITEVARSAFFQAMDAANVDLKAFTEEFYQHLTLSHLQPVLDTLIWLKNETDVWFEITNLIIPQANDSEDELKRLCEWIVNHLGDEVPVHFSAFHPDFRLRDRGNTPLETLLSAHAIARHCGIRYAYVGNVNDVDHQSTYCPDCGSRVIERDWYQLGQYWLDGNRCVDCQCKIAGHFDSTPGNWGRKRLPVRISQFQQEPTPDSSLTAERQVTAMSTSQAPRAEPEIGKPTLSDDQKQAIFQGASEVVAESILGYRAELSDSSLAGSADQNVLGCFVTIKRKGRLRGCCGSLGAAEPLRQALVNSAVASATRDMRLPSISSSELPYLDLHISLLHSLKTVVGQAESRLSAVKVGTHGLQVAQGQARGLLLPSVATEHELTPEQFLQQVCMKANLPPTAWKDSSTQLATFEAVAFGDRIDQEVVDRMLGEHTPRFSSDELDRLALACGHNILSFLIGATPTYYLPNCPDGTVNALTLTLNLPGIPDPPRVSQMSIRPGLPLQSTLLDLSNMAARLVGENRISPEAVQQLRVGLLILHDPAMHGTLDSPDLEGFDVSQRALMIKEEDKSAWIFDPSGQPDDLLKQVVDDSRIVMPERTTVLSFEAASTDVPVMVVNIPKPQQGEDERPPAVAGTFYPDDPQELSQVVDKLLGDDTPSKSSWAAAMVPHAGLIYSGRIAAEVLRKIQIPDTVIVIGPKHTRLGVDWAAAPHDRWMLPGITVASDPALAKRLCEAIPRLQLDALAHKQEHAIEIELPLLARLAPQSRVVGLAIGPGNLAQCREFAKGLASAIGDQVDNTLLVISSDMNHFANDAETRRLDELALSAIERLDPEEAFKTVRDNNISMCGVIPAVMVMMTLQRLGKLRQCQRVDYATSADVSGDKSRVVGYAGMLFK